jgi:hypothetical protein
MIQLLKSFVEWLEKRFPPKVVVTLAEYEALQKSFETVYVKSMASGARLDALEARQKKIDEEINKFNVAMGLSGPMQKASWQR